MNKEPDNRDLAQQVELLKKDYEIMQTDIQASLNVMKTDLQATLEKMRVESAQRDAEFAKRDTRLILTIVGLLVAGIAIQGFVLN